MLRLAPHYRLRKKTKPCDVVWCRQGRRRSFVKYGTMKRRLAWPCIVYPDVVHIWSADPDIALTAGPESAETPPDAFMTEAAWQWQNLAVAADHELTCCISHA